MAFYSPQTKTITLRIVYDGLGTAGKTTNVHMLHAGYTLHRASDVYTPELVHGRTAFFDWLELSAGTLDEEHTLRCQVLTVPGQFAYAARRWELLRRPDAVVAVCDSSRSAMARAKIGLSFLRELRDQGVCPRVPVVVQANKRDLPDALPLPELRAELGIGDDEPLVEAVASAGDGVKLTFLTALDLARAHVRRLLRDEGLSALESRDESPAELLATLEKEMGQDEAFALVERVTLS